MVEKEHSPDEYIAIEGTPEVGIREFRVSGITPERRDRKGNIVGGTDPLQDPEVASKVASALGDEGEEFLSNLASPGDPDTADTKEKKSGKKTAVFWIGAGSIAVFIGGVEFLRHGRDIKELKAVFHKIREHQD